MKSHNVASFLTKILENQHEPQSRIVVLTGARQTGKTTLARTLLPDYRFLSIEDPVLPAWERNSSKRLVKAPKLHFLDYGVLQAVIQKRGTPTGYEFESLVVAEMYKQARYLFRPAEFSYLRTLDGKEVDALIELPEGYFAFKIKMAERAVPADARSLRKLGEILDKPLLHSFVLSNDPQTRTLGEGITAVHAAYFLG